MKVSWRVLARRIAKRLPPGFLRFEAGAIERKRLLVVAYYRRPAPEVEGFTLKIAAQQISVDVRTKVVPRPRVPTLRSTAAGVAFSGVHPGAGIAVDIGGGVEELGGICALLAADATATEPSHLLTCGHVFPPKSKHTEVSAGFGGSVQPIGTLVVNLLEKTDPLDIALVALNPLGRSWATAGGPGPKLADYFPAHLIFNRSCRTYKPTTGRYSSITSTEGATINAHITSRLWPGGFSVQGVIATTSAVSIPGDSGTVLSTSSPPIAIGSCSASDGSHSLFEPIGRAIEDVFEPRYNLTLWRNS
jgi:hypothetical protein